MCWYMVCVVSLGLWFWSSGFWGIVHWVDNLVSIVLSVVKKKAHFFFADFFALRYILQLFQNQAKCEGLVRIFPTSSSCCKVWSRAGNIICECEEDELSIYVQAHQSSLFLLCIVFLLQFCPPLSLFCMFFAASQADCVALLCVLESIVAKDFFTAIAHIYIVVTILMMILCLFSLPSSTNLNFDVGFLLCFHR